MLNFSKENCESLHNKNYWFGKEYLGLGPSAHSFNGVTRRWNTNNINDYCKGVNFNRSYYQEEITDSASRYNEYIINCLKTKQGVNIFEIEKIYINFFKKKVHVWLMEKYVVCNHNIYKLSRKGLLVYEKICEDLIFI